MRLKSIGYSHLKTTTLKFLTIFLFLIILNLAAFGQVVCSYTATTSPEQQGWEVARTGTAVTGRLIRVTPANEEPAWQIRDGTHENAELYYTYVFSQKDQEAIAQKGWKLTVILEVEDCDVPADNEKLKKSTSQLEVYGGENGQDMQLNFSLSSKQFGSDGNAAVIGIDGTRIDNAGFGYHKFEAQAKANQDGTFNVKVWVDGRSRYGSANDSSINGVFRGGVRWGSFGDEGTSVVNWHRIVLETLDESNELKIVGKDKESFDFALLEDYFNATFEVDAPQPISNMPLGKCAEFIFKGVPVAISKPMLNNMHEYYEFCFSVRNPDKYDFKEDIEISMLYDYQDNLKTVTVHGDLINMYKIGYQYNVNATAKTPLPDVARLIKRNLYLGIKNKAKSAYLSVLHKLAETSIIAVDSCLIRKQSLRQESETSF